MLLTLKPSLRRCEAGAFPFPIYSTRHPHSYAFCTQVTGRLIIEFAFRRSRIGRGSPSFWVMRRLKLPWVRGWRDRWASSAKRTVGKCSEGFRILFDSFGVAFGNNRNVLLVDSTFLLSPISRGAEARLPSEPLMHRKLEYGNILVKLLFTFLNTRYKAWISLFLWILA